MTSLIASGKTRFPIPHSQVPGVSEDLIVSFEGDTIQPKTGDKEMTPGCVVWYEGDEGTWGGGMETVVVGAPCTVAGLFTRQEGSAVCVPQGWVGGGQLDKGT